MEPTSHQTGEVVVVPRSSITKAPYNPRRISASSLRRLRENIKRVGLVGPAIVVNRRTGNVISGHQRLGVLDAIEERDDYALAVTMVDWSEDREKEQNLFFNSPDAQGEFDADMLAELLAAEIDWEKAGLDRMTIEGLYSGTEHEELLDTLFATEKESTASKKQKTEAERIAAVKRGDEYAKKKQAERADNESYICLVFTTDAEVRAFLKAVGEPEDVQYVDGRNAAKTLGVSLE
jgi:hypothetical protein